MGGHSGVALLSSQAHSPASTATLLKSSSVNPLSDTTKLISTNIQTLLQDSAYFQRLSRSSTGSSAASFSSPLVMQFPLGQNQIQVLLILKTWLNQSHNQEAVPWASRQLAAVSCVLPDAQRSTLVACQPQTFVSFRHDLPKSIFIAPQTGTEGGVTKNAC